MSKSAMLKAEFDRGTRKTATELANEYGIATNTVYTAASRYGHSFKKLSSAKPKIVLSRENRLFVSREAEKAKCTVK